MKLLLNLIKKLFNIAVLYGAFCLIDGQINADLNKISKSTMYITGKHTLADKKFRRASGVIYKSSKNGSYILTNSHVCNFVLLLGKVQTYDGKFYKAHSVIQSKKHDLCRIFVKENLKINNHLSPFAPEIGDEIIASGYPLGYFLVTSRGTLGISEVRDIVAKEVECTLADLVNPIFKAGCEERNLKPVFIALRATYTSVTAHPGNSGSGVYNKYGHLIGLILATQDETKRGLMVPYQNLKYFLEYEVKNNPTIIVKHVK